MKDYIEERAIEVAEFIVQNNATVRQTAGKFGISKSTVHAVVTMQNDFGGELNRRIMPVEYHFEKWYSTVFLLCKKMYIY